MGLQWKWFGGGRNGRLVHFACRGELLECPAKLVGVRFIGFRCGRDRPGISAPASPNRLLLLGKLGLGYMTERVPARFVMMVAFGGQIVGIALMLTLVSGGAMWLSVGLFGFFMGSFGALAPLLVQDSFGIKSFGSIMGFNSATTVVSFGLGPLGAGLSYDLTGGYGPAFVAVAVGFGVAAIALTQAGTPSPSGPVGQEGRGRTGDFRKGVMS